MAVDDPHSIIAHAPMGRAQIAAIAVAVGLNALDGFDVLSISFASPGIAKEWGIDRAALGIVLSMELIGMAIGSIALGQLCDRIGRRPTVLGCLALMATGMALASTAGNVQILSVWRLLTGLGIGGMLAATNAVVAEFANARRRNLAIALMAGGYPVGAVLGGTIASALLVDHGWRSVFLFGTLASAAFIPLVLWLLPETPAWLAYRRPANAIARINTVLARLGHDMLDGLPEPTRQASHTSFAQLFDARLAPITLALTWSYFAHIMTFYFILKWTPKIVADMGFSPSAAGGVLVWANVGGALGSLALSLLTQRFHVKTLTITAMGLSVACVALFGRSSPDLAQLGLFAALAGFCTNGAIVGLYAIFAEAFPTAVRAGGTGFVIGVGRGGAALSPVIAGALFQGGVSFPTVALLMAMGSAFGVLALIFLRVRSGEN